jgi:hypothetical protein
VTAKIFAGEDSGGQANNKCPGHGREIFQRGEVHRKQPYTGNEEHVSKRGKAQRQGHVEIKSIEENGERNGNHRKVFHDYILGHGFEWVPTMKVGMGCQVHLRPDELPTGALIVKVSKHLTAVVDGIIEDTHDPSRGGKRCVYGYYRKK